MDYSYLKYYNPKSKTTPCSSNSSLSIPILIPSSSSSSSSPCYSHPHPHPPLPKHNPKSSKKKSKQGMVKLSTDPQSVAARERRHRISDRFKTLQSLIPGGAKLDTVSMLDHAIQYVKFLKSQIWLHQTILNHTHACTSDIANYTNDQYYHYYYALMLNNNNNNNNHDVDDGTSMIGAGAGGTVSHLWGNQMLQLEPNHVDYQHQHDQFMYYNNKSLTY